MGQLAFDNFTKKIYIKAPIQKLYWCWATVEGIESWFLKKAIYTSSEEKIRKPTEHIQSGDSYTWQWHNWEGQEKGKVLYANGKDSIEISFTDSKVMVSFEEKKNAVLLTLRQYGIPTDEQSKLNIHYGCSNGWTFWLTNLKAYIEHGILLNETEFDLGNNTLAGFEFVNI